MARTVSPREPHPQAVGYISRRIGFNTAGIGAAGQVLVGVLPGGAQIVLHQTDVTEPFNGTTPLLVAGTADDDDAFVAAADITEGTPGRYVAMTGVAPKVVSVDTPIYARFTGAGATTGQATMTFGFVRTTDG